MRVTCFGRGAKLEGGRMSPKVCLSVCMCIYKLKRMCIYVLNVYSYRRSCECEDEEEWEWESCRIIAGPGGNRNWASVCVSTNTYIHTHTHYLSQLVVVVVEQSGSIHLVAWFTRLYIYTYIYILPLSLSRTSRWKFTGYTYGQWILFLYFFYLIIDDTNSLLSFYPLTFMHI